MLTASLSLEASCPVAAAPVYRAHNISFKDGGQGAGFTTQGTLPSHLRVLPKSEVGAISRLLESDFSQ